jgi:hypothetical protein
MCYFRKLFPRSGGYILASDHRASCLTLGDLKWDLWWMKTPFSGSWIEKHGWISRQTQSPLKSTIFWDMMPCSQSLPMFCRTYYLHLHGQSASQARNQWDILLIAYLAYSLTLKMKAVHSSKPLVNFCQAVQHHIP